VGECSKTTKANVTLFSNIQAQFHGAVGCFTGIREAVNNDTQLAIDNIESVHAASQAVLPAPVFNGPLQGNLRKAISHINQNYSTMCHQAKRS